MNYSYDWHRRWVSGRSPEPQQGAKSGIRYADEGIRVREFGMPFQDLTGADADTLDDFLFDVGTFGQFLLCLDPAAPARCTAFCSLVDEPDTRQSAHNLFAITHRAIEMG